MVSILKFQPIAVGSLPLKDVGLAMKLVEKDFAVIPFLPQLVNISKNEDIISQFTEGMPSFFLGGKCFKQNDEEIEKFYSDYNNIFSGQKEKLEKYAISPDFSHSFADFEKLVRMKKPVYAKLQITGPFTLCDSYKNEKNQYLIYDEKLKDILIKLLELKVLWMIERVKKANSGTKPIIFIDEPYISQLNKPSYKDVARSDVISMLSNIVKTIHENDAISGIHCCGDCDWSLVIESGSDIINPDIYYHGTNFLSYDKDIAGFLKKGGKISWGIVPTRYEEDLKNIRVQDLLQIFESALTYLTKNGIDEKLITENSLITSSCGAGTLRVEMAERAMDLVFELSKILRERY